MKFIGNAFLLIIIALAPLAFAVCSSAAPPQEQKAPPAAPAVRGAADKYIAETTEKISRYTVEPQALDFGDFISLMDLYLSRGIAWLRNQEAENAFSDFMKVKVCTTERSNLYKNVTFDPGIRQDEQPLIIQNIDRAKINRKRQSDSALCLSWIYAARADYLSALNEIETAAPDYAGGYYHSKYLFYLGKYAESAKYLEDILSNGTGVADGMIVSTGSIMHREDEGAEVWKVIDGVFIKAKGKNPYFYIKKAYRMQLRGLGSFEAPLKQSVNLFDLKGSILPSGNYSIEKQGTSQVNIVQYTKDGYLYTSSRNPDSLIKDRFYFSGGKIFGLTDQEIIEFSAFEEFEQSNKK